MSFIKKSSSLIFFLCVIFLFSISVWYVVKPFVFLPMSFQNSLEMQVAYENSEHELFAINFNSEKIKEDSLTFRFGEKGDEKILNIQIPYDKSNNFYMYFGKEGNIVKIEEIKINGKHLSLDDFYNSLEKQHFKIGRIPDNSAIFLQSKGTANYKFDFTSKMEYLSGEKLNELVLSDFDLTVYLLVFIFLGTTLFWIIGSKIFKSKITINTYLFFLSLCSLIFTIHTFCIIVGSNFIFGMDEAPDYTTNFLKYESNFLPLILFILFPAVISFLFRKLFVKLILCIITLALIFIVGLDNFVYYTFGTRFQFEGSGDFVVDFETAIPFFINYVTSPNGFIAFFSFLLFVGFLVRFFISQLHKKFIAISYTCICLASLLLAFWKFPTSDYDIYFANVFQVNNLTSRSFGNYQVPFSDDYIYRKNLDYKWKILPGLGRKQNVIVILIESLTCDLTKICGDNSDNELMPNLSRIAKDNLLFDNYYSDSYSTSMALLTVIKSFPVFPQRVTDEDNYGTEKHVRDLLFQNDLVSAFSKNGYKTTFFSSTDLVFKMDKNLELTSFDQIFDSNSTIFDKEDKKYIFNSVSDEVLFDKIIDYIDNEKSKQNNRKLFVMTKTASSHVPYTSPWGSQNFDNSFRYTDYAINNFLKDLESHHYFDDGIVVLTGDHQPWGYVKQLDGRGLFSKNQVPLIVIDKVQGSGVNHSLFSHSSLGVYLQSLMLDHYKLNKFNADPIHSGIPGFLMMYEYDKHIFAIVKKEDREARIRLNGDKTEFVTKIFDDDYEQDVLGYLASCSL